MGSEDGRRGTTGRLLEFGAVVFVVTFVVNVLVVALWPDSSIDWAASFIVAGVAAIVLTIIQRTRGR